MDKDKIIGYILGLGAVIMFLTTTVTVMKVQQNQYLDKLRLECRQKWNHTDFHVTLTAPPSSTWICYNEKTGATANPIQEKVVQELAAD